MKTVTYDETTHQLVPVEPTEKMIVELMCTGLRHAEYAEGRSPTVKEMAQGYGFMLAAAPQPECVEQTAARESEDAARWRYMRRKLRVIGNGDGTCGMMVIDLPAAIPGWPEPGAVAEFCDAAIDSAAAQEPSHDGE